jgi:hypothetical protein
MPDPLMIRNIINTGYTLAQGKTTVARLKNAWTSTRDLRENGGCSDPNLAIAEHYLYARYYVAENGYTGWTYMQTLITGYNVLKMAGLDGILPQTGVCAVTPYSDLDVAWSFQGSDDGLNDYKNGSGANYVLKAPEPPN